MDGIDSEIKLELKEMKDEIIEAVKRIIEDRNKELEKYITDINKFRFDSVQKEIDRHDRYHEEHFNTDKNLDDKITLSRESILRDIDVKIENLDDKKRNNLSTIIAIVAVAVSIAAVILSNI